MDPLFLNLSDLRDVERTTFPSSFEKLVALDPLLEGNDDFENIAVSLQHTRSWLSGRYFDVSNLDEVRPVFHSFPRLTPFSPPRSRSLACSTQARGKIRPLTGGSSLRSFVSYRMFKVEQS
jgi:hypothetical protein